MTGGGGGGGGTVATVGTFDGIHRGHQAVLHEVVRRAGEAAAGKRTSLLVTFDPHPLEVVNPSAAPRLLTLPDEKRARAAALGVERVEVVAFTPELARLGPEDFVRDVQQHADRQHDGDHPPRPTLAASQCVREQDE